jgi:hypothetical protein
MRPPRIAKDLPVHARKPNLRLARQHQKFINALPCVSCGAPPPSECAHVRTGTDGGTSLKPSDRFTVPLCTTCHLTGKRSQHEVGELRFWARLRIDPLDVAQRLWTISGDVMGGERVVFRARQRIALQEI